MKRLLTSTLILTLLGTSLIACSSQGDKSGNNANAGTSSNTEASTEATTYPIKTDKKLTYWGEINGNLIGVKATHDEIPFFQDWQKQTGVPLEFTAPPTGQTKEALNVMLASGDLPDMIEYNYLGDFPGGPEKAINDGYILKLNDLIDKHAPNLKKFLQENPDIDKMVKTDSGSYYAFPFIRGDEYLRVFQGPIIRKDWLDELGLPVPETIDDWTKTLTAFKEKKGAAAPFAVVSKPRFFNESGNGAFIGAFGVTRGFYLEDGTVKFGPAEAGFKEYLSLFSQWYGDGLLDKNIATADSKSLDGNMAGYVAEVDDMMVCLVNFGEKEAANLKEELHAIAAEAQRFLLRYQMDLTVSIGGIHASLPGIAEAYREAVDAMAYKMVLGKQEIITYDEIRRNPEDNLQFGYYYPLQVEQQLINLIKVGDFEQASKFMEDVMDRNFNKPIMSLTLARCLIFNLVGTMVKAINELGDGDSSILGDNPLWMDKIIACDTILEMKQELLLLLKEVCAFAAAKLDNNVSQERAESLRDLVMKVSDYIREKYRDSNLNVNTIGEYFDLKGSYLSKLFKNQTGEGLLDYINKHRIEQAKRMMKLKQDSISEIAKQVGYNEVATFIRVFKKYEGITPGKFKEMN